MTHRQRVALENPCRLAEETAHPRFARSVGRGSLIVSVNSGYECIERNFGGPVWHASGRGVWAGQARMIALSALEGVGDLTLGQWEEKGRAGVYHIRRRLSADEQKTVGEARDIRGTPEEARRMRALLEAVSPELRAALLELPHG